jgi:hypothetical protein
MKITLLTAAVLLTGFGAVPTLAAPGEAATRAPVVAKTGTAVGIKRLGLQRAERYRRAARASHSAATSGVALSSARSTMKLA